MDRARRAGSTALVVLVMTASLVTAGGAKVLAGVVAWPPSSLVVSEIQNGGSSASDEFVELANQGTSSVDLLGLEVVYATSSGSTVTRKGTWTTTTSLAPGQRILLVNTAGSYAGVGDIGYSGGFAATGGAIALRVVGGAVVDAVGWGDATNGFVEGTVAGAPPAGSSLERRPGGSAGNATDTNDNAMDWFISGMPAAQNLASPAVPGVTPTPTSTPSPTATPSPTPAATPTPDPTPAPTPDPTANHCSMFASTSARRPSPCSRRL